MINAWFQKKISNPNKTYHLTKSSKINEYFSIYIKNTQLSIPNKTNPKSKKTNECFTMCKLKTFVELKGQFFLTPCCVKATVCSPPQETDRTLICSMCRVSTLQGGDTVFSRAKSPWPNLEKRRIQSFLE